MNYKQVTSLNFLLYFSDYFLVSTQVKHHFPGFLRYLVYDVHHLEGKPHTHQYHLPTHQYSNHYRIS
uniref:Putative ovule protein n=1 Tax=Solanum chacoense TaxID=4108 RepID=A0A0V0GKI7_SOLCH